MFLRAFRLAILFLLATMPPGSDVARGQGFQINPGLAAHLRSVTLRIVSGRLRAFSQQPHGSAASSARGKHRTEKLTINTTVARPTIVYQFQSPELEVAIDVRAGTAFTLRRQPGEQSELPYVLFSQEPDRYVELTIGDGADALHAKAASIWHLLLAYPEACHTHLVPLLETIRPDWGLIETAKEIEALLVRAPHVDHVSQRQIWQSLVVQLGDERFATRRAADRKLRQAGPACLPFLESLDRATLDAEQNLRLRRITSALSGTTSIDRPHQAAARLVADPRVWLGLLQRPTLEVRRLAIEHLEHLLGEPIEFDPNAEAAPRAEQLQILLAQLDPQAAVPPPIAP